MSKFLYAFVIEVVSLACARLSRSKERVWSNCILRFVQACQQILGMLIGLSTAVMYCDSLLRIKLVTLEGGLGLLLSNLAR